MEIAEVTIADGIAGDVEVVFDRGEGDLEWSDAGVAERLLQFFNHNSGVIRAPAIILLFFPPYWNFKKSR